MYSLCLFLIHMFTHTAVVRWDSLIQQIKGLSSCPYYRCCWRAVEDAGAQRRVGVGRAGGSVGGRAGRAGAADYSGNCQLQCLQSGSNRFRVGEEEVTVDFCQASLVPVCLPAEWDDIREGDGGNVPPPHPLLNNSSACSGSLQVCGCGRAARLLMEPVITNTDILTFK